MGILARDVGRLGKRCVDGACGGWGESLWSAAMTGICVEGIQKGRMTHGEHGRTRKTGAVGGRVGGFGSLEGFSGI